MSRVPVSKHLLYAQAVRDAYSATRLMIERGEEDDPGNTVLRAGTPCPDCRGRGEDKRGDPCETCCGECDI